MLEIRNRFLNKKSIIYIGLIYTAFAGMFNFPISWDKYSQIEFLYLQIPTDVFMFWIISFALFAYFNKKTIKLFFSVFALSGVGMVGRYFLEYGEVSNERNFTPINIIVYLTIVPIVVTLLSFLLNKIADSQKK